MKQHATHNSVDEEKGALVGNPKLTFKHEYPATKLMFVPVCRVHSFHRPLPLFPNYLVSLC